MATPRLFDAHTHAFPDKLAARAVQTLSQGTRLPYYHDGTFAGLCDYERRLGASGFMLLPIATKPSQTRVCNQWAAEQNGKQGCAAFGSVHPDSESLPAELDEICALGLKGIKLHPEYQDFYADDERVFPLYEEAFKRNLIVWLHAGEDLGFRPPVKATPARLAAVARRYPQGRLGLAHLCGTEHMAQATEHILGLPNVWMDTSFSSLSMDPTAMRDLIRGHGIQRICFATDAPWADPTVSLEKITGCGLTEEELEWVLHRSAETLLGL